MKKDFSRLDRLLEHFAETSVPGARSVRVSVYAAAKTFTVAPSSSMVATGQGCRPQIHLTISRGLRSQSIGQRDLSSICT